MSQPMNSTRRIALLLFCSTSLIGCASTPLAQPAWPETITYERLDLSDIDTLSIQTYALADPALLERLNDSSRTLTRAYPVKGPTGHGSVLGTTVYYIAPDNQFYFQSPCLMGHNDGVIGPFPGDPRAVLAP